MLEPVHASSPVNSNSQVRYVVNSVGTQKGVSRIGLDDDFNPSLYQGQILKTE